MQAFWAGALSVRELLAPGLGKGAQLVKPPLNKLDDEGEGF